MQSLLPVPLRNCLAGVLFAEDFDLPAAGRLAAAAPESVEPELDASDLEAARQDGFACGLAEGRAVADATAASAASRALAAVAAELAGAERRAAADAEAAAVAVARLLTSALAAMLPALCDRHGGAEVGRIAAVLLPALRRETQVTIRTNPDTLGSIAQLIDTLDVGATTRIELVSTPGLRPDEMRIAWRDGWAERNRDRLWDEVRAALGLAGLLDDEANATGATHAE